MSKFKAPSLAGSGIIKPAPVIRDDEIPTAEPNRLPDLDAKPAPAPAPTPAPVAPPVPARRGKAKAAVIDAPEADLAHRSLYAKPETLELIREIAFKKRVSAQSLYRRGLLLMLQEEGHYADKGDDDV